MQQINTMATKSICVYLLGLFAEIFDPDTRFRKKENFSSSDDDCQYEVNLNINCPSTRAFARSIFLSKNVDVLCFFVEKRCGLRWTNRDK